MKKKKLLCFALSLLLLIGVFSVLALPASAAYISGDFQYTVSDGKATITDYTGSATKLTIPSSLGGYPVTCITSTAFYGCDLLTSVTIGNGITSIWGGAFGGCNSLTNITVEADNSFYSSVDGVLFDKDKTTIIKYPEGKTNTAYTVPDGVTSIGDGVFSSCSSLTSVTIPDSVTSIEDYAFNSCKSLTNISVGADNPFYSSVDGVLFDKNKTTIIKYPAGKTNTAYTFPNGVTSIGSGAFEHCNSLTSISIPNSVTSVGHSAFWYCRSLTSISIPDSVTSIGGSAFNYTGYHNDDSNWEHHVLYIGNCLIDAKHFLSGAYMIKPGTRIIGDYAFSLRDSLTSVTIPDSVTSIGAFAFYNCDSLKNVWYTGSQEMRVRLDRHISSENDDLTNATWHYDVCSEEHTYGTDCDTTCDQCDWVRIALAEHVFHNDCDTTCNVCDFTRTTEHIFDNACDTTCNVCENIREVPDHVYDSICDADCNMCGHIRQVPGHAYDNACDTTCNVCSNIRQVPDHAYDSACDADCNACGIIRQVPGHKVSIDAAQLVEFSNNTSYPYAYNGNIYTSTNKAHGSCSTFTIRAKQAGTVTLEYSVSSEKNYDKLTITKNGTVLDTISGTVSWKTLVLSLVAGDTVTIAYGKDGSQSSGNDSGSFKITVNTLLAADTVEHLCDEAVMCDVCGAVAVPAVEHTYTLNAGHTCAVCSYSRTPDAPTLAYKDSAVVILTELEGLEYSLDGVTWQDSPSFAGLAGEQTHSFYQRVKESQTATVSQVSEQMTLTLKALQTPPADPVVISFTDSTVQLLMVEGCEYRVDDGPWQSYYVFTDLQPATCYVFCQRKAENSAEEASAYSFVRVITDKGTQPTPPAAPTLKSRTEDTITLNALEGYEYSLNGIYWQESPTFTGLACGTAYTFYQRLAETDTHYAGKPSIGVELRTDKGVPVPPPAPVLQKKTHNCVTLELWEGCEYSADSVNWQLSPVFPALSPETNYLFYVRYAENDRYYASAASTWLVVRTKETPQCAILGSHEYDGICDEYCNYCDEWRAEAHIYENACDADCNICGSIRVPAGHIYSGLCDPACNVCGAERIGSTHSYTNACDKDCNVCGEVRQVTDHQYQNACDPVCGICQAVRPVPDHVYKNACDMDCDECGAYRVVGNHVYDHACDQDCNVCGDIREVPDHVYSSKCDTECNVCRYARQAQPHTYSHDCDKTCNVCGFVRTTKGHVYTNACDATCNECGAARTPKAHKYSNACDTTCNVCGFVRTTKGHKYTNACDATCNECGAKRTPKAHVYTDVYDATCNVCGAVRTPKAHVYSHAHDTTCNECGAVREVGKHTYSNSCDTTCNVCKSTRTITHAYKTTTTKATLSKNGSVVKKCTVCGKVASKKSIKQVKTVKLSATGYTYNGKVKTPAVTVKDSAGKTLKKNTDYTVTYATGRKNVGTYKVTIKGKGKYAFTKTLTFKITPAKTTVSKLTAGKKRITVDIAKKSAQVTGYQVQYATSKTFNNPTTKTISSFKTTKYTLTGLRAKITYYVRVRTYKTVNGTKYYSGWSAYKYVKTK